MKAQHQPRLTLRWLLVGLAAAGLAALPQAAVAQGDNSVTIQTTPPPTAGTSADSSQKTSAPTNAQLLNEVAVLDQVNNLQLTAGQIRDIVGRLSRLDAAEKAFDKSSEQDAKPVRPQLERIRTALDANKPPSATDEAAVSKAIAGLNAQRNGIAQLRQQTIDGIRQELSRSQLDAVRLDVGMEPAAAAAQAAAGPQAGPEWASAAYNTASSGVMGPLPTAANSPYVAANLNADAAQTLAILDQVRVTPLLTFQQQRLGLATALATAAGAPPGSPDFAQARETAGGILENIRAMDLPDYEAERQQIAANIALQAYQTQLNAEQLVQNAVGAVTDSDNQAVSAFFLNEDMLRALRGKLMR